MDQVGTGSSGQRDPSTLATEDPKTEGETQTALGKVVAKYPNIMEVVKRAYDENRMFVPIAPGMSNQIYRNGLLTKKTVDKDNFIRMTKSKRYYRE